MHSMTFGPYYVHFNGDFSGDVIITDHIATEDGSKRRELAKLPYWLLEEIVAEKVRRQRIAALESATRGDIIK
jgi:hypothetical protein